ncbi:hypothetical protein RRG08_057693 [Elysia crispata]|uniref:Uncharacterized protein n=1 Tax=Elysia crispata TaxID=231223 RepID=A0AAE1DX54_9GAST|nr:hypothetical protein RRG08_057693 [Elysia crispata]
MVLGVRGEAANGEAEDLKKDKEAIEDTHARVPRANFLHGSNIGRLETVNQCFQLCQLCTRPEDRRSLGRAALGSDRETPFVHMAGIRCMICVDSIRL